MRRFRPLAARAPRLPFLSLSGPPMSGSGNFPRKSCGADARCDQRRLGAPRCFWETVRSRRMARSVWVYSFLGAVAMSAGCSSTPAPAPAKHGKPAASTAEPSAPAPIISPEDLPVPADGFQLHTVGADIAPGEDVEYCEIGELPGDPSETYYVTSVEIANAAHSHHVIVS